MSDRTTGTAAAAVGAHSKDAMEAAGAVDRPRRPGEPDLAERLSGVADRVATAANDAGEAAGRTAREVGQQVYDRGAEAGTAARRAVRDNPMPAMLLAGAVGMAIGLLMARR